MTSFTQIHRDLVEKLEDDVFEQLKRHTAITEIAQISDRDTTAGVLYVLIKLAAIVGNGDTSLLVPAITLACETHKRIKNAKASN
jgi:hypothetical protein